MQIQYNEYTTLEYTHEPILASSNQLTGTKYITKLYLVEGNKKYMLGEWDEKLDEENIKLRFAESMNTRREQQYGSHRGMLRKNLPKQRSTLNRGIAGSIVQR